MLVIIKSNLLHTQFLTRLWLPGSPPENFSENILEALIQNAEKAQKAENDEQSTLIQPMRCQKSPIFPYYKAQGYHQILETELLRVGVVLLIC